MSFEPNDTDPPSTADIGQPTRNAPGRSLADVVGALKPRHQTIVSAHDWNSRLLSKKQVDFRRLTVFVGGLALDSAGTVAPADASSPDIADTMAGGPDHKVACLGGRWRLGTASIGSRPGEPMP
jgi:hypothetical protein